MRHTPFGIVSALLSAARIILTLLLRPIEEACEKAEEWHEDPKKTRSAYPVQKLHTLEYTRHSPNEAARMRQSEIGCSDIHATPPRKARTPMESTVQQHARSAYHPNIMTHALPNSWTRTLLTPVLTGHELLHA